MKRLSVVFVLFAVFMCISAGVAFAESCIPDLKGKWQFKSYSHHHEKRGFFATEEGKANGLFVVKEQQGRFFFGERSHIDRQTNKRVTEGFSGVISRDGKRVYLVDYEEDFLIGDILSDDSIELIVINEPEKGVENQHSKIGLIEIERIK